MTTKVYLIRALTNLHPGKGDAGYGVVDKLVQRDPIHNVPTIHMSSIKGALREFLKNHKEVEKWFGSSPTEDDKKVKQGKIRFLSADLLVIPGPTRDEDKTDKLYQLYYSGELIGQFLNKVSLFGPSVTPNDESWVSDDERFKELIEDLPVIARNYLDNGISQNLWYEEVIPRETQFGCIIQGPKAEMETLHIEINEKVIQIGGNATVGYGYCLFIEM